MLKTFVQNISPLHEALLGAESQLLTTIQHNFRPQSLDLILNHIKDVINHDVAYQKTPLDLRNQRTYAVKVYHFWQASLLKRLTL